MKIHNFPVIAAMPRNDDTVVMMDRGEGAHQRYVTGLISNQQFQDGHASEWWLGHYHDSYEKAILDLVERALSHSRAGSAVASLGKLAELQLLP